LSFYCTAHILGFFVVLGVYIELFEGRGVEEPILYSSLMYRTIPLFADYLDLELKRSALAGDPCDISFVLCGEKRRRILYRTFRRSKSVRIDSQNRKIIT
jgi:hypothetical protein